MNITICLVLYFEVPTYIALMNVCVLLHPGDAKQWEVLDNQECHLTKKNPQVYVQYVPVTMYWFLYTPPAQYSLYLFKSS